MILQSSIINSGDLFENPHLGVCMIIFSMFRLWIQIDKRCKSKKKNKIFHLSTITLLEVHLLVIRTQQTPDLEYDETIFHSQTIIM